MVHETHIIVCTNKDEKLGHAKLIEKELRASDVGALAAGDELLYHAIRDTDAP